MYWLDAYADFYQQIQGFEITIFDKDGEKIDAYMSFKQSTRSTYDIAMREATIDALVTMEDISKLKVSQIFYKNVQPDELFIIQAVNKTEQQVKSKNINAIKQNCKITILRQMYDKESKQEVYKPIYKNVIGFASLQHKDQKNFSAGVEDNTIIGIQIPKKNIVDDYVYEIENLDRILIEDMGNTRKDWIKIESIDAYGVSGVLRIQGTFDTRTGKNEIIDEQGDEDEP